MNYLNGGYVMLDKADSDIYAKASGALKGGKPILWYEDKDTCYFIDSISKSGDDIVLTKGGKTITITSANAVTESGNIQQHFYQYRVYINECYGCVVTLPFKLKNDEGSVTNFASITDSEADDIISMFEQLKGGSYGGMEIGGSPAVILQAQFTKGTNKYTFKVRYNSLSATTETTKDFVFNLTDGVISSVGGTGTNFDWYIQNIL